MRRDFDISTSGQKDLVDPHTDKAWTNNDTKDCRAFLIFYRRNGQEVIVLIFSKDQHFHQFCLSLHVEHKIYLIVTIFCQKISQDIEKINIGSRETMQWRRCNKMPNIWFPYSIVSNLRSNIFAPKSIPHHKKHCSVRSWSALSAK